MASKNWQSLVQRRNILWPNWRLIVYPGSGSAVDYSYYDTDYTIPSHCKILPHGSPMSFWLLIRRSLDPASFGNIFRYVSGETSREGFPEIPFLLRKAVVFDEDSLSHPMPNLPINTKNRSPFWLAAKSHRNRVKRFMKGWQILYDWKHWHATACKPSWTSLIRRYGQGKLASFNLVDILGLQFTWLLHLRKSIPTLTYTAHFLNETWKKTACQNQTRSYKATCFNHVMSVQLVSSKSNDVTVDV